MLNIFFISLFLLIVWNVVAPYLWYWYEIKGYCLSILKN